MAKGLKGSSLKKDAPKRTSLIIKPSTLEKIGYIAFKEKRDKTAIVDEALGEVIKRYEKKNGPIKIK